ncbi:hypothetical protein F9U64_01950 [Gracilibacillus oryzae]|uniref:DUF1440 domain-containing protein n=1 Tax=Gracilibacillus oryzae TaxID=1672701 RepID=A0A7C8L682_9BACI|nr:hypothetical protein [Gracilibacillus oryzae]KAB8139176.1 hypothetical protein F9U64_01950 [Gracilibacillus oryzae]
MIRRSIILGTISGTVLGSFMWVIERIINVKVYTLLMNVDFIPFFEGKSLSPVIEWFFHLLIAWLIAYIYFLLPSSLSRRQQIVTAFLISIAAAFSYFPLTLLAKKDTPAIDDFTAITLWFLGHLIYGLVLFTCGNRNYTTKN